VVALEVPIRPEVEWPSVLVVHSALPVVRLYLLGEEVDLPQIPIEVEVDFLEVGCEGEVEGHLRRLRPRLSHGI